MDQLQRGGRTGQSARGRRLERPDFFGPSSWPLGAKRVPVRRRRSGRLASRPYRIGNKLNANWRRRRRRRPRRRRAGCAPSASISRLRSRVGVTWLAQQSWRVRARRRRRRLGLRSINAYCAEPGGRGGCANYRQGGRMRHDINQDSIVGLRRLCKSFSRSDARARALAGRALLSLSVHFRRAACATC